MLRHEPAVADKMMSLRTSELDEMKVSLVFICALVLVDRLSRPIRAKSYTRKNTYKSYIHRFLRKNM
jgi:hypothetical protein